MPSYKCSDPNGYCPKAGSQFALNESGLTRCPHCWGDNSLTPVAPVVRAPATQMAVLEGSTAMDDGGQGNDEVAELIAKWDLDSVTTAEAKKTADCVYKLGTDRRKRIDREGSVKTNGVVTHARFRLQFGSDTYAGLHIQVDTTPDPATIRRAWETSLARGKSVQV